MSGQGGVHIDPTSETYFSERICVDIWVTGKVPKKPKGRKKKSKIRCMVSKWRPMNHLKFRDINFPAKKFPEGIFLRNLAHK